jgi:gamma-glutamyltranspeptidase/glutathione hydrolase
MVCAPQPEAVEAGIDVLHAGGTAIDAAVACSFVQGVVDPLMCGIAGFGTLAYFDPDGTHEYLDFHAPAPLAATPQMWEALLEGESRDGLGFQLRGRVNDIGYGAIAVPGSLKGFGAAHERWGRLPWADLVESAIGYARDGWAVRPAVAEYWGRAAALGMTAGPERVAFSQSGRRFYCRPDGTPKAVGDLVQNPDLADTLSRIARAGADDLYTGEIAAAIAADMAENGGLISTRDLAEYRVSSTPPLEVDYRGHRITTNRPPGGGVVLGEMLGILQNFDLAALGHNSADYVAVVAEAMKHATIDKDAHVGDPAFVEMDIEWLLSPERLGEIAATIRAGGRADVVRLGERVPADTTHISVVDADGRCVSVTHSLGSPSGVITEGLGFMYNGCMGVFDPRPGRTGSIAPGKARFTAACPSIVFRDGRPYLVLGAPGGTQVSMGVLQTILNVIDFGMSMPDAVAAPRFSATSNPLDLSNRIPRVVERDLRSRGYATIRSPLGYAFSSVHAIRVAPDGLEGGADPSRDGVAMSIRLGDVET